MNKKSKTPSAVPNTSDVETESQDSAQTEQTTSSAKSTKSSKGLKFIEKLFSSDTGKRKSITSLKIKGDDPSVFTYWAYGQRIMIVVQGATPLELRKVNKELGRLMYMIYHWNFNLKTFEPFTCFPSYKEARSYCDKIYASSHMEPRTQPTAMEIN